MENNVIPHVSNNTNATRQNGLAVASMVCGIVGVVLFCVPFVNGILALLAFIFGIVALNQIKNKHMYTGQGMAIAGIVLGSIFFAITIICYIFFPFLAFL